MQATMKSFVQCVLLPLLTGASILGFGYCFAALLQGNFYFSSWPTSLQVVVVIFGLAAALISGSIIFGNQQSD